MRVMVMRTRDDFLLNIRYIDELLEYGILADEAEADAVEKHLKTCSRYYLKNADTYLKKQGETAR